jgi:hypothetical protein
MPTLTDCSLVLHLFAPVTGPRRTQALDVLREVWRVCTETLDMREPVPAAGVPADPPPDRATGPGPVAARRRAGSGVFDVFWMREHDVECVSLAMSSPAGVESAWRELHAGWVAATAHLSTGSLLGTVEIFSARTVEIEPVPAGEAGVAVATGAHLPGDPPTAHHTAGFATADGIAVWGVEPVEPSAVRRLVAIAPNGADLALSGLIWTRGTPTLAPLTRYLLHRTKVDYELRIWQEANITDLRQRADATVRAVLTQISTATDSISDAELRARQRNLTTMQTDERGLVETTALVRTMRQTVRIAAENMRMYRTHIQRSAAVSRQTGADDLFTRDRHLVMWFHQQLDHEAAYLSALHDRVHHAGTLLDRELSARQTRLDDAERKRQERFGLLQTAIVGTVLMCLTAIQSLGYQIPLPGPAKPAVVAALGAATFWLSTAAVRLALHGSQHQSTALRWLERVAAGSFAATVVWLLISWTTAVVDRNPVPPGLTVSAAAAAFIATVAGVAVWQPSRRPSP